MSDFEQDSHEVIVPTEIVHATEGTKSLGAEAVARYNAATRAEAVADYHTPAEPQDVAEAKRRALIDKISQSDIRSVLDPSENGDLSLEDKKAKEQEKPGAQSRRINDTLG